MARLVSRVSGDFTNSATWRTCDATSAIATTSSTNSTTAYVYSPAFTLGNGVEIEGIALFLHHITASGAGTFSVALSEDDGATAVREVTINLNDVQHLFSTLVGTWVFFKFPSVYTADGGADYKVGVKSSVNAQAVVYRGATAADWARLLVTTTAAAPAAADDLYIMGEHTGAGAEADVTVTMDNTTTTAFGVCEIADGGILTWGTTASTNYVLRLGGLMRMFAGGIQRIGTSGTRVPRSSTAVLEFVCASNGQFGLRCEPGMGGFDAYGESRTSGKNVVQTLLTTDHASGVTTLDVAHDTGWLSGDTIVIASTNIRSSSPGAQVETKILNGNATSNTLPITVATSHTHHGGVADPDVVAEVINLTRNIVIRSTNTSFATYVYVNSRAQGSVNCEWVQFDNVGFTDATRLGVHIATTQLSGSTYAFRYCSLSGKYFGFYVANASAGVTFSFRDCVVAPVAGSAGAISVGGGTGINVAAVIDIQDNCIVSSATGGTGVSLTFSAAYTAIFTLVTVANNRAAGGSIGLYISGNHMSGLTVTNTVVHSTTSVGVRLSDTLGRVTLDGLTVWRCNDAGLNCSNTWLGLGRVYNLKSFGNLNYGVSFTGGPNQYLEIYNGIIGGDSTYATTYAFHPLADAGTRIFVVRAYGVNLNPSTGIKVPFSTGLWYAGAVPTAAPIQFSFMGGDLAAVPLTTPLVVLTPGFSFVVVQNNTVKSAQCYEGTVEIETTTVDASPGLKLSPLRATEWLDSAANIPARGRLVRVAGAATTPISVKVRKNGTYNGDPPQLVQKANFAAGLLADVVIDTMSVGADTWETLSGTSTAMTYDGVAEFVVRCNGTAGAVFVDSWGL